MDFRHQDYIRALYTRFTKESVNGNPSSAHYTEEELLDIFDFAGDIADDFTQLMVLFKAAADYPDDRELLERKGIFLSFNGYGNVIANDFFDSHNGESALWDIMRIYVAKPLPAVAVEQLNSLMSRYDEFDDEAIIRLVDLVVELDCFEWLLDHMPFLKSHALYPETLYYEVARECIDRGLNSKAIELLSELTDIEPFDAQYWKLLAQQYVAVDNFDKALNAIDYALAVDGKDLSTIMLKAQIVFDRTPDHGDAVNTMERLHRKYPDDATVAFFLAQMYTLIGRKDESKSLVLKFLSEDPGDLQMIQGALLIHDDELTHIVLARYLEHATDLTDDAIEQYSNHLAEVRCKREAVILQLLWYRRNPSTHFFSRIVYGLYLYGDYHQLATLILDRCGKFPMVDTSLMGLTEWSMALLALVKEGKNYTAAVALSASLASLNLMQLSPSVRLAASASIAIGVTLSTLLDKYPGGIPADDIDSIDPFRV